MSRDKLRQILALLEAEARNPGPRAREVVQRLRELAALYEQAADGTTRITDRRLLRAVELMHERLAEAWTVASLARAVGMSRAAFARGFSEAFGTSPLLHLHEQRMLRAAALLTTTDGGLAGIAELVGYQSEFAFSRAFKRHHGVAPGAYRRAGVRGRSTTTRLSLAA